MGNNNIEMNPYYSLDNVDKNPDKQEISEQDTDKLLNKMIDVLKNPDKSNKEALEHLVNIDEGVDRKENEFNLFALQMIDRILTSTTTQTEKEILNLEDFNNQSKLYETSYKIRECMKLDKSDAITVENNTPIVKSNILHELLLSDISDHAKETLLIYILGNGKHNKIFEGSDIRGNLQKLQLEAKGILQQYTKNYSGEEYQRAV